MSPNLPNDCLFCKIRDGQIPAKIIHRDDICIGFEDIRPQAPTHVLFIPLEHVETVNDLSLEHREKVGHLFIAAAKVAKERGLETNGYRLVMNCNADAGQTVFHVHLHMLGGRTMTWPPG